MKIAKILNNNVIQTFDERNQEMIVMGRGIAFSKRIGDWVDSSKIEKTFVLQEDLQVFSDVYKQLSLEEIDLVFSIVELAEVVLKQELQSHIYLSLADHLHYAIERHKAGLPLTNPLMWEVRRFYKTEYQLGLKALDLIEESLGCQLDEVEAASIALHLINAQKENQMIEQTMQLLKIIQDIVTILRMHYGREFDKDSITYQRFMTHLQYFAQRVVNRLVQGRDDSFLFEEVQKTYPKAFQCTAKIKQYIEKNYNFPLGQEEQVYLTIHIQKLAND